MCYCIKLQNNFQKQERKQNLKGICVYFSSIWPFNNERRNCAVITFVASQVSTAWVEKDAHYNLSAQQMLI